MQTDELRPGLTAAGRLRLRGCDVSSRDLLSRLRELAGLVRRLPPPSSSRPDVFHEARSEVAHELDKLADELSRALP